VNPLTLPFKLPLLPLQAVIRLAKLIEEQAEQELHDPARVRRELEDAQRRAEAGEITDEELAQTENAALSSLIPTADPTATSPDDDRS
jgi:hypothetical protein